MAEPIPMESPPSDPTESIALTFDRTVPAALKYRLLSWTVDAAILIAAFLAANAIHQLLGVAVLAVGAIAYYVLLVGGDRHATIGHQVAKVRIVDVETLEPIDMRTAGLRAAINAMLALPFGVPLLLNVPVHSRYPGAFVHDLSSGTRAVRMP